MCLFNISDRDRYWIKGKFDPVDFGISKYMSRERWYRFLKCLRLPKRNINEEQRGNDPFGPCRPFLNACVDKW
jgi:hypothetical protein